MRMADGKTWGLLGLGAGVTAALVALIVWAVLWLAAGAQPAQAQDGVSDAVMWPVCSGGNRAARRLSCVVDGDTFWNVGVRYRLSCIDAVEIDEPDGTRARDELRRALAVRGTRILLEGRRDPYGRELGSVMVGGDTLFGAVLVNQGLARWVTYRQSAAFCAHVREL